MNTAGDDPTIPPEWPPLIELPDWVRRIYGVGSDAIRREFILAVRSGMEIRHRVLCERRYLAYSHGVPPRFDVAWSGRVFVADWERAEADWQRCTVGGWKQGDGTRERLAIEVPWQDVTDFVTIRLARWKQQANSAALNRTGAAGRPSSISNLVRPELIRRAAAGETLSTVTAETQALSDWLAKNHPNQPQVTAKALENSLRAELRKAVDAAGKRGI